MYRVVVSVLSVAAEVPVASPEALSEVASEAAVLLVLAVEPQAARDSTIAAARTDAMSFFMCFPSIEIFMPIIFTHRRNFCTGAQKQDSPIIRCPPPLLQWRRACCSFSVTIFVACDKKFTMANWHFVKNQKAVYLFQQAT